ncbi:MAG: RsbRD N-terminal domain-containing protein [Acidobacteriia bacterium]|nr:RsbRD N-terminal domain-containing protein [Terriglobia bacterium]
MECLLKYLACKKKAIVAQWLEGTLRGYEESTARFLLYEQDRFRNPVGHTLKESLPALFDALLDKEAAVAIESRLDAIIRMRAVQEFSASEAVSFVLLLKEIVRQELRSNSQIDPDGNDFASFEARVDGMALLASDLFVKCREQIRAIKADDARRRLYLRERMRSATRTKPRPDATEG